MATSFPLALDKSAREPDAEVVYVLLLAWCQRGGLGDLGTTGTLFIERGSSGFCIFDVGM